MTVPVFLTTCGMAISAALAFQAWPLWRAPGWSDLRWFALAALTGSLAMLCALGSNLPISPGLFVWSARGQISFLALHVAAWWLYAADFLGRHAARRDRAVVLSMLAVALASLAPGLIYGREIHAHTVPWSGTSYRSLDPTPAGILAFAAIAAVPAVLCLRAGAAARRGVPHAWLLCLSFAAGTALGVHDAVAVALRLPVLYLLDVGHVLPILAVAWVNLSRHGAQARDLERLRRSLEEAVRARTRELEAAHESLIAAERAAAVGRFAARLAHDMNNPTAVVASNLRYLSGELAGSGALPADALECLRESGQAMERIGGIARQLRDAAGSAAPGQGAPACGEAPGGGVAAGGPPVKATRETG